MLRPPLARPVHPPRTSFIAVATLITASVLSCSDGAAGPKACEGNLCPSALQVEPLNPTLLLGGTQEFAAKVLNKLGPITNPEVSWTSDSPSIVSVSGSGASVTATARGAGTTVIHAKAGSQTTSIAVTVSTIPIARIAAAQPVVTIIVGQTQQVKATAYDGSGTALDGRVVEWTSLNTGVATVGHYDGVVTAVSVGTTRVVGKNGSISDTVSVNVIPIPVASVVIAPSPLDVTIGTTATLTATPRDGSGNTLSGREAPVWSSADPSVAQVSQGGVVSGVTLGSTSVTATIEGKSSSVAVTVSPVKYAVEVSASPAAGGTVSGAGSFASGTLVTVTANAAATYNFANWTENNFVVSSTPSYQFTIGANRKLVANFSQTPPLQLTVSGAGTGTGTVTATSPGGIACDITSGSTNGLCSASYASGTPVVLTAKPANGHSFVAWGGDCVGSDLTCSLAMSKARAVTANFASPQTPTIAFSTSAVTFSGYPGGPMSNQPVTIRNGGAGDLTGLAASVAYTPGQPTGWLTTASLTNSSAPTVLTLFATILPGMPTGSYTATVQITSPVASNSPQSVAVTLNVVQAPTFTMTVVGSGTGTGTIKSSTGGINCKSTAGALSGQCSGPVLGGSVVTFTAAPDAGSLFTNWGPGCTGTSPTCQITINSAITVGAVFGTQAAKCKITTTALPSSGGTTAGDTEVPCGTQVTVTANANPGFVFSNWNEGPFSVSTNATYTFTPQTDRNLNAIFITNNPKMQITPNASAPYSIQGAATRLWPDVGTISNSGTGTLGTLSIGSITYSPAQSGGWLSASINTTTAPASLSYTTSAATLPEGFYVATIQINSTSGQSATFTVQWTIEAQAPAVIVQTGAAPANGGTVTGGGKYGAGNQVTLRATPNSGFHFVNWTGAGGTVLSTSATYTFPASNVTVTANFAPN